MQGCDTKKEHDKNKEDCMDDLLEKTQDIISASAVRHQLIIFLAINELREKVRENENFAFHFATNMGRNIEAQRGPLAMLIQK